MASKKSSNNAKTKKEVAAEEAVKKTKRTTKKKAEVEVQKEIEKSENTEIKETSLITKIKNFFKNLKVNKAENKLYSVTKTFLITIIVLAVVLFSGGYLLGINFDVRDAFTETQEEKQIKIEDTLEKEIAKLNKAVPDAKLDAKATYITEGTVSGYNYYQYVSYTESQDGYVAWVVDKETKKVISVWTAEQKAKEATAVGQNIIEELVELYKDRIPKDKVDEILEKAKKKEPSQISADDFMYIQQYSTENLPEGYEYIILHELDFFTYTPEVQPDNSNVVVEEPETTEEETGK